MGNHALVINVGQTERTGIHLGDRGNIVVRQKADSNLGDVWFYGHWSGSELLPIVQRAIAKRWRWTDASYLARIIFDEMTKGMQGEETGFGIGTKIGDNEYPIVVVDVPAQEVYTVLQTQLKDGRLPDGARRIALRDRQEIAKFEELAQPKDEPIYGNVHWLEIPEDAEIIDEGHQFTAAGKVVFWHSQEARKAQLTLKRMAHKT